MEDGDGEQGPGTGTGETAEGRGGPERPGPGERYVRSVLLKSAIVRFHASAAAALS